MNDDQKNLVRLWNDRATTLMKSAEIVDDAFVKEKLSRTASAYDQCARELENPPVELFKELGYTAAADQTKLEAEVPDGKFIGVLPNEDEVEAWFIHNYGVTKDKNGNPSWCSSAGYRTEGDLYEMLNDFVKWIKDRVHCVDVNP